MKATFQDLPKDLIHKILQNLSLTQRFRLASVCRALKDLHLDGLVTVDVRKTICAQELETVLRSLEHLIRHCQSTLCSLTICLQCKCLRGDWDVCRCKLPLIALLPRCLEIRQLSRLEALHLGAHSFVLNSEIIQSWTALVNLKSLVCRFEPVYGAVREGSANVSVGQLADFSIFPELRRLGIQVWRAYWRDPGYSHFPLVFPAQTQGLAHLTGLHVGGSSTLLVTRPFCNMVSRLTELSVTCSYLKRWRNGQVETLKGVHPDLDGLNLTCLSMTSSWHTTPIPCSLSNRLTKLDLRAGEFEDLSTNLAFLHVCTGLKSLRLSGATVTWNHWDESGFLDPLVSMGMTSLEIVHLEEMTVELSAARCLYPLSDGLTMDKLLDLKLCRYDLHDDPECGIELSIDFEQFPALERLSLDEFFLVNESASGTLKGFAMEGWCLIVRECTLHCLPLELANLKLECLRFSTIDLDDVDHALDLAMRMPSLNLLELTYVDWDGWRKYLGYEHSSVQEDFELRAHLEFLNHTQTAVCKWRGSMDWKVLETWQTHNYSFAGSFVKLMRSSGSVQCLEAAGIQSLSPAESHPHESQHARIDSVELQDSADQSISLTHQWLKSWSQIPPLDRFEGKHELAELLDKDGLAPTELTFLHDGKAYIDDLFEKHRVDAPVAVSSCLKRMFANGP